MEQRNKKTEKFALKVRRPSAPCEFLSTPLTTP